MTEKRNVEADCLRILTSSIKTEKEVRNALAKRGYESDEINRAVSYAAQYGYIDDRKYAGTFVRVMLEKKKSISFIEKQLKEKGIDREITHEAIETLGIDRKKADRDAALKFAMAEASSCKEGWSRKLEARIGRKLYSRGFGSGTIYDVLDEVRHEITGKVDLDD